MAQAEAEGIPAAVEDTPAGAVDKPDRQDTPAAADVPAHYRPGAEPVAGVEPAADAALAVVKTEALAAAAHAVARHAAAAPAAEQEPDAENLRRKIRPKPREEPIRPAPKPYPPAPETKLSPDTQPAPHIEPLSLLSGITSSSFSSFQTVLVLL